MEVRTLGGERGGQDATIILIPKGGSRHQTTLAHICLHSHVLSTHSKYFRCLSKSWGRGVPSVSAPAEFVLEVQTDVQYYFDCFSNMYPPSEKSFESVKRGMELLKVASQIDFQALMERISFFLSSMYWSEVEEIRVREYATSPDFPRIHLKDLVARLGLDESVEDRQKQLHVLFNGVLNVSSIPSELALPAFLETIRCAPSEYPRKVVAILSQAAKEVFVQIERDCVRLFATASAQQRTEISIVSFNQTAAVFTKIRSMSWVLEALLKGQVAEELVQGIVHLDKIPKCISLSVLSAECAKAALFSKEEFAELVLVMFKEVVAGRLVLKPPERLALLANWHPVLKSSLQVGTFEQAAADLFLTLPLKQKAELIHLQKERVFDFISTSSLVSLLHFH